MHRLRPLADKNVKMSVDRRIARTRESLIDAFVDLVLEHGYARTGVGTIVERANVGRSTFYEHFENKEDLFRTSLARPLAVLATAVLPRDDGALEMILAHFLENRRFALNVLNGPSLKLFTQ